MRTQRAAWRRIIKWDPPNKRQTVNFTCRLKKPSQLIISGYQGQHVLPLFPSPTCFFPPETPDGQLSYVISSESAEPSRRS